MRRTRASELAPRNPARSSCRVRKDAEPNLWSSRGEESGEEPFVSVVGENNKGVEPSLGSRREEESGEELFVLTRCRYGVPSFPSLAAYLITLVSFSSFPLCRHNKQQLRHSLHTFKATTTLAVCMPLRTILAGVLPHHPDRHQGNIGPTSAKPGRSESGECAQTHVIVCMIK